MADYSKAKKQFLEWLQEKGENCGYSPETDFNANVLLDQPRLLARTRASVQQRNSLNFKVNDEVTYDSDEFEKVYSIILDIHDRRSWNPEQDSFYSLSLKLISDLANEDINGDHPVTINLSHPGVNRQKDRLQTLFPSEDIEETQTTPADRIKDEQTRNLNDIAKNL